MSKINTVELWLEILEHTFVRTDILTGKNGKDVYGRVEMNVKPYTREVTFFVYSSQEEPVAIVNTLEEAIETYLLLD